MIKIKRKNKNENHVLLKYGLTEPSFLRPSSKSRSKEQAASAREGKRQKGRSGLRGKLLLGALGQVLGHMQCLFHIKSSARKCGCIMHGKERQLVIWEINGYIKDFV